MGIVNCHFEREYVLADVRLCLFIVILKDGNNRGEDI